MKKFLKITAALAASVFVITSSAFAVKLPDGGVDEENHIMFDTSKYSDILAAKLIPSGSYKLSGSFSGCWDLYSNKTVQFPNVPKDLTKFDKITFSVYSPKKTNTNFALVIMSPASSAGACYYLYKQKVDWEGWKDFSLKLNSNDDFTTTRTPSWNNINNIYVQSNGFSMPDPEPDVFLYFDKITLVGTGEGRSFSSESENSLEKASENAVVFCGDYKNVISNGKLDRLKDDYAHEYINGKVYVNDNFVKYYLDSRKLEEVRALDGEELDGVKFYPLEDVARVKKLKYLKCGMLEAVSKTADGDNISGFENDETAYIAKYKISYSDIDEEKAASEIENIRASAKQRLIALAGDKQTVSAEALTLSAALSKELAKGNITRYSLWDSTVASDVCLAKTYPKILTMALAYNMQGTDTYKSAELLDSVRKSLDWMEKNKYGKNETTKKYTGNWWNWCIGAPLDITDILLLMQDDLTEEEIARYLAPVNHFTQTGGSLAEDELNSQWLYAARIKSALLSSDVKALSDIRDNVFANIKCVSSGDGFYPDGSYKAHGGTVYSFGYGSSTLFAAARNAAYLSGSEFKITDPNLYTLESLLTDVYSKLFYKGRALFSFDGDGMNGFDEYGYTASYISALADVYDACGSEKAASEAVGVYNDAKDNINLSEYYINKINAMPKNSSSDDASFTVFNDADRAVYGAKDFSLCIAMSSDKVTRYESIDSGNAKGWYTGDGAAYLYTDGETNGFANEFYNNADMTEIPGTTEINSVRKADAFPKYGALLTDKSYAGSVSLGGLGVSAMDFKGYGDEEFSSDLTAKKSYFITDGAILCVGSGISSSIGKEVKTYVDNTKIKPSVKGDNYILFGGRAGYCILSGAYETEENGDYNVVSLNHGLNPYNAKYAYAILPNADKDACKSFLASSDAELISCSESVHAVKYKDNLLAAFYSSGEADGISTDTPLMLIKTNDEIKVYEPTGKYKKAVITVDGTKYETVFDSCGICNIKIK